MLDPKQLRTMTAIVSLVGGLAPVGLLTLIAILVEGLSGNIEFATVYFIVVGVFLFGCGASYYAVGVAMKKIHKDYSKMMENFGE